MVKIGVCDVSEDEARRTIYLLKSQMGKTRLVMIM